MWEIIINIVLAVLSIALALVSYYFDIKKKLIEQANVEIADAENLARAGQEKMEFVVDKLYNTIVPAMWRPLLTKPKIEVIVQAIFDKIEEYAQKQSKTKKAKK